MSQNRYKTAEAESRCDGGYHKDAARNKELLLSRVESEPPTRIHVPTPEQDFSDPRSLLKPDLSALIEQVANINIIQKKELYKVLVKYIGSFTSKPGVCNLFSYKFQVEADRPLVGYNRPIAFALRPAVRLQIEQMLKDGILEASSSPFLNPLTIVQREGKKIRICLDARKINQNTVPDRERTPPLHELLQKFDGARYMTSLDLSSAYLQVELDKDSRKYTAFLFDSTVYQFKRVPYGFRNSLPAFVRALKLALGGGTEGYVVFYIEDILVHPRSLGEHLIHLDSYWQT